MGRGVVVAWAERRANALGGSPFGWAHVLSGAGCFGGGDVMLVQDSWNLQSCI